MKTVEQKDVTTDATLKLADKFRALIVEELQDANGVDMHAVCVALAEVVAIMVHLGGAKDLRQARLDHVIDMVQLYFAVVCDRNPQAIAALHREVTEKRIERQAAQMQKFAQIN